MPTTELTDDVRPSDPLVQDRPAAPQTWSEWMLFEADDYDRAAELAKEYVLHLDCWEQGALLTASGKERAKQREAFLEWLERHWN